MKKILITGAGSYIGTSVENYLSKFDGKYQVDTLDMLDKNWREKDFSPYDCVFHVAGIAHIKETAENASLYYTVNRDLAVETAEKAKESGVGQFIFLSSMSVYGIEEGAIGFDTKPCPKSNYGKSKLQAEEKMASLASDSFRIATLRPPMVYGDGCKGNYQSLIKFAKICPVFPNYKNKRSVIHIDALAEHIKTLIDQEKSGLFLPQDEEYACTCQMVRDIAEKSGKKLPLLTLLNPAVSLLKHCTTKGKKAFGDLYYTRSEEETL